MIEIRCNGCTREILEVHYKGTLESEDMTFHFKTNIIVEGKIVGLRPTYHFHLCDDCVNKLITSFKVMEGE